MRGASHSYAFVKNGIYAYQGRGRAGKRLAISDRLPVPIKVITDLQAGTHPGSPVYLLARGHLYRSSDAGRSWQTLRVRPGPAGT